MNSILRIGLAAFFGIIFTTVAGADTKRYGPFEFDTMNPEVLVLAGPIDLRSALTFRRAIDNHPSIKSLLLNSVGGSVYTALLIADDVHRTGDVYSRGFPLLFGLRVHLYCRQSR